MARFSLRQLLVFVFAGCVYLAALRNFFGMFLLPASERPALGMVVLTQIGAWLILSAVYCNWQLTASKVVHLAAFAGYLSYRLFVKGILPTNGNGIGSMIFMTVVLGCANGTLVSFPIAVLTLAIRSVNAGRRSHLHGPVDGSVDRSHEEDEPQRTERNAESM